MHACLTGVMFKLSSQHPNHGGNEVASWNMVDAESGPLSHLLNGCSEVVLCSFRNGHT